MTTLKRKYEPYSDVSETKKKLEDIHKRAKQASIISSPQKTSRSTKLPIPLSTRVVIKPSKDSVSFEHLPDEVIAHIFEYFLDFKNRLTVSKVCHRWNALISHSWKQYFLHQFGNTFNRKQITQEYKHIGQKKGIEQTSPDWRLLSFSFARFVRELHRTQNAIDYKSLLEENHTTFDPFGTTVCFLTDHLVSILLTVSRVGLPLSEFMKIATKHQVVVGDRPRSEIKQDLERKLIQMVSIFFLSLSHLLKGTN